MTLKVEAYFLEQVRQVLESLESEFVLKFNSADFWWFSPDGSDFSPYRVSLLVSTNKKRLLDRPVALTSVRLLEAFSLLKMQALELSHSRKHVIDIQDYRLHLFFWNYHKLLESTNEILGYHEAFQERYKKVQELAQKIKSQSVKDVDESLVLQYRQVLQQVLTWANQFWHHGRVTDPEFKTLLKAVRQPKNS